MAKKSKYKGVEILLRESNTHGPSNSGSSNNNKKGKFPLAAVIVMTLLCVAFGVWIPDVPNYEGTAIIWVMSMILVAVGHKKGLC